MTLDQILKAIEVLLLVVQANKGNALTSEKTLQAANEKIIQLIALIPNN